MEELLKLLMQSRRQGSTTALLKASAEYNGIVVVHDMQYARELKRAMPRAKIHSVIEAGHVNDCMNERGPILVDNGLIIKICEMGLSAKDTCNELLATVERCHQKLFKRDNTIRDLEEQVRYRDQTIYHLKYSGKSIFRQNRIQAMKVNRKIRNGAGFKSFFATPQP